MVITDVRERIADALRKHYFWWANHSSIGREAHCKCGERPRDWSYWADHSADALLSLPGIAIVEMDQDSLRRAAMMLELYGTGEGDEYAETLLAAANKAEGQGG